MQFLARALGRWWLALPIVAVLAAAILMVGIGSFGLWEPQERQLADKNAPRLDKDKDKDKDGKPVVAAPPVAPTVVEACPRAAPKTAVARTLGPRAMAFGRDELSDSDAGRRMPFAILGILLVLATAGIAMRTVGARAGVIAALVLLSMPLCILQSRQLMTEIGTATAGALVIYGLLALSSLEDVVFGALLPRMIVRSAASTVRIIPQSLEAIVGALALAAGLALGFVSGGALLGVAVPVGAFAAAGALGIPTLLDVGRLVRNGAVGLGARLRPRWGLGRTALPYRRGSNAPALLATAIAGIAIIAVVYQIFSLKDLQPGLVPPQRAVLDHAIVANGCWSPALGGAWRPDDDLRYIFDSTFEQIAYGTFPWGVLGPIAFAALIASDDPNKRRVGSIALAWASAAWIGTELFQRKVGFALYAGFPAFAIAIGAWIDGMSFGKETIDNGRRGMRLLVGAFAAIAIVDLSKDLQSFTEKLTSILVGGDTIAYPAASKLVFLPTRLWLLGAGLVLALSIALTLALAGKRGGWVGWVARVSPAVVFATTILFAAFWSFGWQPALSTNLSSKSLFETIESLRKPGDAVILMGDLGDAPHDYAPKITPEVVTGREQVVAALARPNRVFAIAPATELCQLHREIGGKPYFVIDDRNVKSSLLSNKVDGTTDKNPLGKMILHAEPKQITHRPKGKIVFDNKIELLGWDIPDEKHLHTGDHFEMRMYYRVLQSPGGAWQVLFHFTGPTYFNGDHFPIDNKCPTSTWQPGDYIVDTHTMTAAGGGYASGVYEVHTGFFTGTNPNFKNMTVTEAPNDMRDKDDRVKITTITVE